MPKPDEFTFYFNTMWRDDRRREWVLRHDFNDNATARRAHRGACAFDWRVDGMQEAIVSPLYAVVGGREREIEQQVRHGEDVAQPPNPPAPWDVD